MEPTSAEVVYIINTTVADVEHRFQRLHVAGHGPDSIFKTQSVGWFVLFEGSHESLYMGQDFPNLTTGDAVEIRIRKANAQSSPTPK